MGALEEELPPAEAGDGGVDRAALDVAIKLGIPHGGWVPKGRLAEDGPISEGYRMRETSAAVYSERTEKNVIDSDGTLIISRGDLTGAAGTWQGATEVRVPDR